MFDISTLEKIKRPRLLLQAARIAVKSYRRERDLTRLLKHSEMGDDTQNLARLSALEGDLDLSRRDRHTTYSVSRHVEVLAALLAELHSFSRRQTGCHLNERVWFAGLAFRDIGLQCLVNAGINCGLDIF